MRSRKPTSEQPAYCSEIAIRQFLAKAGEVYSKEITPALTSIWIEQLGQYPTEKLDPLFRLLFAACKFFPTPADVLEPLRKAEGLSAPIEAEQKWEQVLAYAQTISPDYAGRPVKFKEQTRTAISAAGGLDWIRDCPEDDLQWARKRFIEAYAAWNALERNQFLLPDGELKNLIAGAAQKLLPESKP